MSNESDAADAGAVDGASRPDGEAQAGNEEHVGHEPAVAPGGFELGTDGPKVILAGLDGSDSSWRATAYAAGLARRQGALLAVAYVQPILGAATALAGAAVEETT